MNTATLLNKIENNKTIVTLLLLFILCINYTFATHNIAGYITCQHITGYTYKIQVVTFTKADAQADRCQMTIYYSTGDTCIAPRVNGVAGTCPFPLKTGELIDNNTRKNIYECTYTFPNQNLYTISISDPNRSDNINNIPNSVNIPFYVETKLFVFDPNNYCVSNNIGFANIPITEAIYNHKYESDVPISFSDGDSLTYYLTPCMVNGTDIGAYNIPTGMIINEHTGRITWLQPSQVGSWAIAVLVKKWKQGILVGTTILDYTMTVLPPSSIPINIYSIIDSNCTLNNDSTYQCNVNPNDTISIKIIAADSNITTNLYTEIDTTNRFTLSNDTTMFTFIATNIEARNFPYKLTFRETRSSNIYYSNKDYTFFITVNDTTNQTCPTPPNLSTIKSIIVYNSFTIYPNPATNKLNIQCSHCEERSNLNNIIMYDILGNEVINQTLKSQTTTLGIEHLTKGIYSIKITNGINIKQAKVILQ